MGGIAALLGLVSFAVYLHGAYPSISVGDSGEFITAAWTLGIAHAPGFPVYSLLGHVFASLLPYGNIAYRLNVFSALAAGFTVAIFFLALRRAGIRNGLAIGSALVLMISSAFLANARASEVFALNALFVTVILSSAIYERWGLAFFLTGVAAGNHQIILFLLPILGIVLLLDSNRPAADRTRQMLSGALFFLIGLTTYVALTLRADQAPFLNVGHPDTFERLVRVIRRADYGSLTLALGDTPERTIKNTVLQLNRLLLGISKQCTWGMVIAALAGLGGGLQKSRRFVRLSIGGFLILGPFFFLLGNLPFDAQSNGLLQRFLIAPSITLLFLGALGLEILYKENRWCAGILLFVALGWQTVHADWQGFRQDYTAYSYGRNNLRSLPPHARLIMDGGDDTFYALAYLTQVEGLRPDIQLNDRGGIVFESPYGLDFRSLDHGMKEVRRQEIETSLLQAGDPLYYSTMNSTVLPGAELTQEGILYAAHAKGSNSRPSSLWPLYDLRGTPPWDDAVLAVQHDYRTRALTPFYAYQRAVELGTSGSLDSAWNFLKTSHQTGPDVLWLTPNVIHTAHAWAYQAFTHQHYAVARDLYRWILGIDPTETAARQNLQVTESQLQHAAH
jgi:hypothetical protein